MFAIHATPSADARCHPHPHNCWTEGGDGIADCTDEAATLVLAATINCVMGEDEDAETMSMIRFQSSTSDSSVAPNPTLVGENETNAIIVELTRGGDLTTVMAYDIHFDPTVRSITWTGDTSVEGTFDSGDDGPIEAQLPYHTDETSDPTPVYIAYVMWDGHNGFTEGAIGFTIVPQAAAIDTDSPGTSTTTPAIQLLAVASVIGAVSVVLALRRGKY